MYFFFTDSFFFFLLFFFNTKHTVNERGVCILFYMELIHFINSLCGFVCCCNLSQDGRGCRKFRSGGRGGDSGGRDSGEGAMREGGRERNRGDGTKHFFLIHVHM